MTNNTICCDRTSYHSDICFMRGDVRTQPSSFSTLLISSNSNSSSFIKEKIRPYTRKWEAPLMKGIPVLHLKLFNPKNSSSSSSSSSFLHQCDVTHNVTAIFFSLGGYTSNIFHAFVNGLVPLYVTSRHLNRQVVFVVLQYQDSWYTKYREILSQLSDYPLIDFSNDTRTHCFPEAIVGLRYHDTMTLNPSRTQDETMTGFRHMLAKAYQHESVDRISGAKPKKLVIMARKGTRAIENEAEVVYTTKEIGFNVEVLRPEYRMQLSTIYESLSSCDVMMGVHGAGLTHYLFMRPGSLFIQIVPLGTDKLAKMCFGEMTTRIGVEYEEYKILPKESSLYREYGGDDPIVRDPDADKE